MGTNKHNPDNRLDNVEKIQDAIENTEENIIAANETLSFSSGEEKQAIQDKNERRRKSIDGMKEEMQDEQEARENGYSNDNM
ncbi:small acid-soluble spore protein Tlp [Peribacillus frigoritolerans]|jgi:small acid-soluble spore protein (thioredoxin-like protein)|uniref:small acid-soluble spore protein Tlp n=1 Tax=Peribacillus TaxID=2675229 RepID=UPI0007BEC4EF|nr:small acid-soluble spore protein Tlp [Peribacillus frigoritolerans]MBD8137496.1 small acid-soluble spore protein Tlp [Bacillus sp. CFBP 13597]MDP9741330.1 small acid-soluble spore protein (thioredoxin-like protein) [Bacillus sp. B2I3]MCY9006135.1 small acid-soluble spore protein Tlp [Peribacillus frigoritolerans]MED3891577.1 small acid-soluble spore protein Tlp [Peribacillus frigoritolerans]MED4696499.1 small acid-soluble spore protein Tlp [Peribacillus frigoritolerans]